MTAEFIEQQRKAALTALAAAKQAAALGQLATAATKLLIVEVHLLAMAPGSVAVKDVVT